MFFIFFVFICLQYIIFCATYGDVRFVKPSDDYGWTFLDKVKKQRPPGSDASGRPYRLGEAKGARTLDLRNHNPTL